MAAKFSRRQWAALTPLPFLPAAQAEQQPAARVEADDLAIQRENLERWREQLKKVKLPITAEPAFQFQP